MKEITITVSKELSFLVFLRNLSNTPLEKKYVDRFGALNKSVLDSFFDESSNLRASELEEIFSEYGRIQESFPKILTCFWKNFCVLWDEQFPLLQRRVWEIERRTGEIRTEWFDNIASFFKAGGFSKVNVLIVNNFLESGCGSSNRDCCVILEPRNLYSNDSEVIRRDLFVLFHELTHKIVSLSLLEDKAGNLRRKDLVFILEWLIEIVTLPYFYNNPDQVLSKKLEHMPEFQRSFYKLILDKNLFDYTKFSFEQIIDIALTHVRGRGADI